MVSHLTFGSLGGYSGKLLLNGASYPLTGVFSIFGRATNHIARPTARGGPLTVTLALGWTNDQITGVVSSTNDGGSAGDQLHGGSGNPAGQFQPTIYPAPPALHQRRGRGSSGLWIRAADKSPGQYAPHGRAARWRHFQSKRPPWKVGATCPSLPASMAMPACSSAGST